MAKGCDYSWARPNVAALRSSGITFACRYVSHDNTGKNLTAGEAGALRAVGIDVVTNWEFDPRAALNGHAQGVADAANGINMAVGMGQPPRAAIYFSVDFDAQDSDIHAVAAYIDGATSAIGWDRVGVYGGYRVIANMAATSRCKYFWQTSAWSGGKWHPAVHIRQTDYNIRIGGGEVDIDQSMSGDIGSWNGPGAATGAPVPSSGGWDIAAPLHTLGDALTSTAGTLNHLSDELDSLFR